MCMGFWVGMLIYFVSKNFEISINTVLFGFIIAFIGSTIDIVLEYVDLKIGELKNAERRKGTNSSKETRFI